MSNPFKEGKISQIFVGCSLLLDMILYICLLALGIPFFEQPYYVNLFTIIVIILLIANVIGIILGFIFKKSKFIYFLVYSVARLITIFCISIAFSYYLQYLIYKKMETSLWAQIKKQFGIMWQYLPYLLAQVVIVIHGVLFIFATINFGFPADESIDENELIETPNADAIPMESAPNSEASSHHSIQIENTQAQDKQPENIEAI